MKIKLKILAATIFMTISMAVAAQRPAGDGADSQRSRDPIQRAEMQTKMMVDSLSLSTKQGEKVKEINLKFAKKQQEARQANAGGPDQMRATMDSLRSEQNAELKIVLTQAQFDHWQKIAEEQRKQRGRNGGDEGKNRKGKNDPPPTPQQGGN